MRIHSYLSPDCEARTDSKIHRWGVFAKKDIKKGKLVAIWGGYVMTLKEYQKLCAYVRDYEYPVQIYKGFFLGPRKKSDLDDCEMFNHCCDANAGVKGQNLLFARRNIKAGEEICFDYETTDTEGLNFVCRCGSPVCRGRITGQSWKNPAFQKQCKGFFSWYIQQKIDRLNMKRAKSSKKKRGKASR